MFEVAHETQPEKKMKSMVLSRSRTIAPGYGDVKSLHILG